MLHQRKTCNCVLYQYWGPLFILNLIPVQACMRKLRDILSLKADWSSAGMIKALKFPV